MPYSSGIAVLCILFAGNISDSDSEEAWISCEGCSDIFLSTTLLKHIGHKKSCRLFYGPRFEEMKKMNLRERNKTKKQRSRQKNGTEDELESQRNWYAGNSSRKAYKKEYYEKENEKRKDSVYDDAKFREAIKIGPLFVCVCCQGGVFTDNVKTFSEKLKKKIDSKILSDFWDFNEERMDPLQMDNDYISHNCG